MVMRGILLGETDSLIFSHRVHIYIQSDVILLVLTRHLWQERSNTMRPLIIPASRLLPGLTLYPHINDTNSEILPPKSAFFRSKTDFLRQHFGDLEHCPPPSIQDLVLKKDLLPVPQ